MSPYLMVCLASYCGALFVMMAFRHYGLGAAVLLLISLGAM